MLLKPWWGAPLAVRVATRAAHVLMIFVTMIHYAGRRGGSLGSGWIRLLMDPKDGALPGVIRLM
jgi:hypothetical protein